MKPKKHLLGLAEREAQHGEISLLLFCLALVLGVILFVGGSFSLV